MFFNFVERQPKKSASRKSSASDIPMLLLHGFTGSAKTMEALAKTQTNRRTICLDLIGHGKSPAPEESKHYSIQTCCQQILDFLNNHNIPKIHLLGYSMGGRVGLTFALMHPHKISSVTLISTSAGLKTEAEQKTRQKSDPTLAKSIQEQGMENFVTHWMSQPLFATQTRLGKKFQRQARQQRMQCNPVGLMRSLEGMGLGAMQPLWGELAKLKSPCLILTGAEDKKFTALGEQIQQHLKTSIFIKLGSTGHAPHLEKPKLVGALVFSFLQQTERHNTDKLNTNSKV